MGGRNPQARVVVLLLAVATAGCGLQTGGLGPGDEFVLDVDRDATGEGIPAEDARREDSDDGTDPVDDGEEPPDAADDAGEEDDGGPIPEGCSIESCNGIDDDCDGRPDDGFECAVGTSSICGPCGRGRATCTADCTWSECSVPPDLCAPGDVEECVPLSCAVGHRTCRPDCSWSSCEADHRECTPGTTETCPIPNCGDGTRTCGADCSWSPCPYECRNSWETCCPGIGCVNLRYDAHNCGSCGHECGFASGCTDGHCWW
jgi:hypothetical protein